MLKVWTLLVWHQLTWDYTCATQHYCFCSAQPEAECHNIKEPLIFAPDCLATPLLYVSSNNCCWLVFILPGSTFGKVEEQKSFSLVFSFPSDYFFAKAEITGEMKPGLFPFSFSAPLLMSYPSSILHKGSNWHQLCIFLWTVRGKCCCWSGVSPTQPALAKSLGVCLPFHRMTWRDIPS